MNESNKALMKQAKLWGMGLAVAATLCSSYLCSYVYRKVWQSHYPELASNWDHNGRFTLIAMYGAMNDLDEAGYAAHVAEAAKNWVYFDPYIKENKSWRLLVSDCLQIFSMGLVQRLTGDISATWAVVTFICICLWYVFVNKLAQELGMGPSLAMFCGIFISCFSYFFLFGWISYLKFSGGVFQSLVHNVWGMLSVGRTESALRLPRPGLSYALFFPILFFTIRVLVRQNLRGLCLSGLLCGLLAYARIETWTTCLLGGVIFCAVWTIKQGFSWKLLAPTGIAVLVSIPWILVNFPADPDLAGRMAMIHSGALYFPSFEYLAVALFVMVKRKDAASLYFASLLLGIFLMLNIQCVTHMTLWPLYWISFANILLFLVALSFLPLRWRRAGRGWRVAGAALLFVAFQQGAGYAALHFPFQGLPRHLEEAYGWLKGNAAKDSVVAALSPETNMLMPIFTHSRTVVSPAGVPYSDIPSIENARRCVFLLGLFNADEERFVQEAFIFPLQHQGLNTRRVLKRGDLERWTTPAFYFQLWGLEKTVAFMRQAMEDPAAHYETDYLWVGPFERLFASTKFLKNPGPEWAKAYENPTFTIYRRVGGKAS